MASRTTVSIPKIVVGNVSFYVTARGLRIGSRSRVQNVSAVLSSMTKSEARRLRKSLRRIGETQKASSPRS